MVNLCLILAQVTYNLNKNSKAHPVTTPYLYQCINDSVTWIENSLEYQDMKLINGNGSIVFSKESFCQKVLDIVNVTGKFVNGNLEGNVKIFFKNKEIMIANFCQGTLHGVLRRFRCEFGNCGIFEDPALNKPTKLAEVIKIIMFEYYSGLRLQLNCIVSLFIYTCFDIDILLHKWCTVWANLEV